MTSIHFIIHSIEQMGFIPSWVQLLQMRLYMLTHSESFSATLPYLTAMFLKVLTGQGDTWW